MRTKTAIPTKKQLLQENEDLRARLDEAEETLRAIRSGEVDALIVSSEGGEQVFTLKGADHPYRMLIEDMQEGAVTLTRDGMILYANRSFAKMLKTSLEKVIGSTLHAWIAPDSQGILQALMQKGSDEKRREELILIAGDGSQVPVYLSVSQLSVDELGDSYCVVATDLTEQKKRTKALVSAEKLTQKLLAESNQSRLALLSVIQDQKQAEEEIRKLNAELEERVAQRTIQLEAANKELQSFAYSVSHDLRAPLRAIDGFTQALLNKFYGQLGQEGEHYLARVRENTQRMGQLIDDLLTLSRVSRQEMSRRPVDLMELAREITDRLAESDPQRKVRFKIAQQAIVEGDAGLLRVALQNLLENAWKFTSTRPLAEIEVGFSDNGGARIFHVRDNGVGFDMAYADKLFGAFQRLHSAQEFPGTGIGLATVQRIIHRHGGRVWAEAAPDQGATFYFTLGAGS